ncbi:DNA polymerase III subunit delta [Paenibacillus sp. J31TS4]|nr:DNA polymerase III subunit delta [Paenibacillus sp. J31TS4]
MREVEQGKARPVYLCYGPEKYRRREFLDALTHKLIGEELKEMAVSRYDLQESSLDEVLDDAETVPFLVERKLIVAENALFFTGAKDTAKAAHRTDRLLEYLKAPVDSSIIVFMVDADKLDERKKLVKVLKDKQAVLAFPTLSPEQIGDWVEHRASRLGFRFAPGAAERFLLYAGTQLQTLASELEKLSLYIGEGGEVDGELIGRLVVPNTEQNVFLLVEELVRRRTDKAFAILNELLKQKEEPIKLLMLIARQYRIVMQVKELVQTGYSHQQIAGQIGVHPYAVKLAAEQGRAYDAKRLYAILSRLAELDYQMKTGQVDKVLGLELLLLELA